MSLPIKINIPAGFCDSETRCEYRISSETKKVWAVQLDLLREFSVVCKRHNIPFVAFGGTMLGAIRHRGYIPWDDDIDVAMTRSDFDRFCRECSGDFSGQYFLQTPLSDRRRFFPDARLRNSLTTAVVKGFETPAYNNGIYIDIFALDGIPKSRWGRCIQNALKRLIVKAMSVYYYDKHNSNWLQMQAFMAWPIVHLLSYKMWFRLYRAVLTMFNARNSKIGLVAHSDWFMNRYWLTAEEALDSVSVPFEMLEVPVPRSYHEVLTRTYGAYREFPPVEKRGQWHAGKISFNPNIPYTQYLAN